MKLFALFGFLTMLMDMAIHMHTIFVSSKSIEDIGTAVSSLTITIEGLVTMLSFYFMRETYKSMIDSILDILKKRKLWSDTEIPQLERLNIGFISRILESYLSCLSIRGK